MAIRTSKAKKVKDRNREVEYESIDDERVRERIIQKAAGSRKSFTRGIPRR